MQALPRAAYNENKRRTQVGVLGQDQFPGVRLFLPAVGVPLPYIASDPNIYLGTSVGSGQCVTSVEAATGAPREATSSKVAQVKGVTDSAI